MLKIKDLRAGYNGDEIIHGIDFEVKTGEIVAIIGPNGSGKSTLLKSIFNLAKTYSGEINYKDKDIKNLKTFKLIKEGICFVPQGRQVFNDLSVLENLEMGAFVLRDEELIRRNMLDVFKKFPILETRQKDLAVNFSGGQQQILAISRVLMQNPQLLLLDEPSLGLSPKAMKEIFKKIQEINKEGVSIIIVEQNAKQAVEIANRTYVLEDGKIALVGGKEILKNKKIKDIYFGGRDD